MLVERGALVVADGFRRAEVGGVGAAPAIRRWLGIVTSGDWSVGESTFTRTRFHRKLGPIKLGTPSELLTFLIKL